MKDARTTHPDTLLRSAARQRRPAAPWGTAPSPGSVTTILTISVRNESHIAVANDVMHNHDRAFLSVSHECFHSALWQFLGPL